MLGLAKVIKIKEDNMYPETMDLWLLSPHYELSHYEQPLLECDIELIKEALTIIIDTADKKSATPEALQIVDTLTNYLNACNNAFLSSERIRMLLLLSLFASLLVSFIAVATIPVSAVSITLIGVLSIILFATNFFTLIYQRDNYQQEKDWNQLKTLCTPPLGKFFLETVQQKNALNNQEKVSSPTKLSCLYSLRNTSQNDEINTPSDGEERLNAFKPELSHIDEESIESNHSSASFSH
jgi:hypothetical protein